MNDMNLLDLSNKMYKEKEFEREDLAKRLQNVNSCNLKKYEIELCPIDGIKYSDNRTSRKTTLSPLGEYLR